MCILEIIHLLKILLAINSIHIEMDETLTVLLMPVDEVLVILPLNEIESLAKEMKMESLISLMYNKLHDLYQETLLGQHLA